MVPRPLSNPPNPWLSTEVEYLDEIPPAELEVYEDHTREILSHNDSPDVGFSWSVNPYRGCFHACAYCMAGETPILMGDGTTRVLADIRAGDVVYGTVLRGMYRRYARTPVLAHWQTLKQAFRVTLEDGTTLVASGDHRFLTERGWKYVTGRTCGAGQRPHLTAGNSLLGTGAFTQSPPLEYSVLEIRPKRSRSNSFEYSCWEIVGERVPAPTGASKLATRYSAACVCALARC